MYTSHVTFPLILAALGLNALACGQAADTTPAGPPDCDGGAGPASNAPVSRPTRPVPHIDDAPPAASAGSGAAGAADAADPVPDEESVASSADVTAPYIVSIKPENGAVGVLSSSPIVIEFSEAMAPPSVLLAFSSDALPLSRLDATWNGAGTVLTLTPKSALEYSQEAVTDAQTLARAANTYGFALAPTATDLAGNPLPEASSSFSTLREITHTIRASKGLTGAVVDPNDEQGQVFGFVTFDGRLLPRGIRALERATLEIPPHSTHEDVRVVDVEFDELSPAAILAGPGTWVGTLPGGTIGALRLPADLCAHLVRDYLAQGDAPSYSQFRLQLPPAASKDNLQAVDDLLDQTSLELVYLLP